MNQAQPPLGAGGRDILRRTVFELARLVGSPPRQLALETRKATPIANVQAPEAAANAARIAQALRVKHPKWERRKEPCGVYNCFGMVWAARRTAIYDQPEIDKILAEDGYRKLPSAEAPQCGDLVLYYMGDSLQHVGMILEFRPLLQVTVGSSVQEPWVLSKWSDALGEDLHRIDDVPLEQPIRREIWTDRP